VVARRLNKEGTIAQEVFRRRAGSYAFRYIAWVNFEDAGGGQHHLWQEYLPESNAVTDSEGVAKELAESHADECGVSLGAWAVT
jgi:hypothetical protein